MPAVASFGCARHVPLQEALRGRVKPLDYGLIAEEVEEIYPDLVVKGADGQIETVQYQKLTPMLVNEVQKEHQHAQQQDETIRLLQEQIRQQVNRINVTSSGRGAPEGVGRTAGQRRCPISRPMTGDPGFFAQRVAGGRQAEKEAPRIDTTRFRSSP